MPVARQEHFQKTDDDVRDESQDICQELAVTKQCGNGHTKSVWLAMCVVIIMTYDHTHIANHAHTNMKICTYVKLFVICLEIPHNQISHRQRVS